MSFFASIQRIDPSRRSSSIALVLWLAMGLFALVLFASAPALAQRQHRVRAGQSLARIARRYRVDPWDLALANGLRATSVIRPGQSLTIPPRGVTYIRPGTTLTHIARRSHCTVRELMRLNRLNPRSRLQIGRRIVLPGYEPVESRGRRGWGENEHPGSATFVRRPEREQVQLVDGEGRVTAEGMQALGRLMRRHEDDEIEYPHPRLVRLLATISDHFGGRSIRLVSGRREAGGRTAESSRHVRGHATDISVDGVPRRALWDFCRSLSHTGCGYYPRSTFVHVDVRSRSAQWVDWAGPGRRARYGNLRRPWPRVCRRARARRRRVCARESRRITRAELLPEEVELSASAQELELTFVPLVDVPEDEELEASAEGEGESPVSDEAEPPAAAETPPQPEEAQSEPEGSTSSANS